MYLIISYGLRLLAACVCWLLSIYFICFRHYGEYKLHILICDIVLFEFDNSKEAINLFCRRMERRTRGSKRAGSPQSILAGSVRKMRTRSRGRSPVAPRKMPWRRAIQAWWTRTKLPSNVEITPLLSDISILEGP